jgi:hypothetical protein
MMSSLLACALLTLFTGPRIDEVPAFDLAVADADVIARGQIVAGDRGGFALRVTERWLGQDQGQTLPLTDTSRLSLHVQPRADGRQWLVVLHRQPDGSYLLSQHPGVVRPLGKADEIRAMRRLIAALEPLRPGRGPAPGTGPALIELARELEGQHPMFAAAALLALARRPLLAVSLPVDSRRSLSALLDDRGRGLLLRDLAARCLCGAADPTLPSQLTGLLGRGQAAELGPLFGRLLQQSLGAGAEPLLEGLMSSAAPGSHEEIVRAVLATESPRGRDWIGRLLRDPVAGPAVRRALGR